MPLQKQQVSVNFQQGVETKTDPWQLPIGKFLNLENSVFSRIGELKKRNGFQQIGSLPNENVSGLATLNGQLTVLGDNIYAYQDGGTFFNKGFYKSARVESLSLSKGIIECVQSDSVTANGITCLVFTESTSISFLYKYAIYNSETGQVLVNPTAISSTSGTTNGSPRVFFFNNNFVIIYSALVGLVDHLCFVKIPINTFTVSAETTISTNFDYNTRGSFDAVVAQNNLYVVWQANTATTGTYAAIIDSTFTVNLPVIVSTSATISDIVTCSFDLVTNNLSIIWFDPGTGVGPELYMSVYDLTLNQVLAETSVLAPVTNPIRNVTAVSENGTTTIIYERENFYIYTPTVKTNFIEKITVTDLGVVGAASVVLRGNGLATKAFVVNGEAYVATTHQSPLQDSYFVINLDGKVVAKYAYQLGDGYITRGLPNVSVIDNEAVLSALIKTFASDTQTGETETAGINQISIQIGSVPVHSAELASTLNVSGGYLWSYDGLQMSENNFFLTPENLLVQGTTTSPYTGGLLPNTTYFYKAIYQTVDNQGNQINSGESEVFSYQVFPAGATFTGNVTLGVNTITNVSSFTNLQIGQAINGTGFALARITAINTATNTITLNANSSATAVGATYTVATAVQKVDINIPTLRITNKNQTITPIFIAVYRASAGSGYQFVSGFLSDSTIDSITVTDNLSAAQIVSQPFIYTNGGVLPNQNGPPCESITLFDNRLWVADTEKPGLLWYSKTVLPGTPVEMTEFQTYYVSPTVGAQGYTGRITALAPMDDKLIIFKEDAIYYINGTGPDATGANSAYSEPIFVTSTVGCKYPKSIVITPTGLMFQSDKGIWLLDRNMGTSYIGNPVEAYTNTATTIGALTIPDTNQVRFVLDDGITLMYDYFFQQWGTFTGLAPTTVTLYKQLHTFFDEYDRLMIESPGEYLDGANPVLMKFKTNWFALAGIQGYQRAYFMYFLGKYITPHKMTINIAYDFNDSATQQIIVTPVNFNSVFGSDPFYGSNLYGGPSYVEKWRLMLTRQKCDSINFEFVESYDSSFGVPAGAGLTLSGLNFVVGVKKGYGVISQFNTAG